MNRSPLSSILVVLMMLACLQVSAIDDRTQLQNGHFEADLNGARIAYQVAGKGPACLVLTNSWGFTADGVRALFGALEANVTMIYFDPRGMGGSDPVLQDADMSMATVRKDADALRAHLGLEKTLFLGWSNGAMNGLLYAAEFSEHVEKAVFLHGIANIGPEAIQELVAKHGQFFQDRAKFMAGLKQGAQPDAEKDQALKLFILETWFPRLFANPEAGKATLSQLFGNLPFSWRHMAYQDIDGAGFDARPMLPKITCPVLVIAGASDLLTPPMIKPMADAMPDARFLVFEHSGHFSSVEEPERFLAVVGDFLH